MERDLLINPLNKLNIGGVNYLLLDGNNVASPDFSFDISSNCDVNLLVVNIQNINNLEINIQNNCKVIISFLADKELLLQSLTIDVNENSDLDCYFADFSKGKVHLSSNINLNGINASCKWHLASLSSHNDDKYMDISVFHNVFNTFARVDNYGVCKDQGKLIFSGISKISKGSHLCKTYQNAKIMVFDERSNAVAKPILKIDENDIEASHAAIVGKINDEHLFYLTSRGLDEAEAKELITLGYLKPILNGFNEEEKRNYIMSVIEERM